MNQKILKPAQGKKAVCISFVAPITDITTQALLAAVSNATNQGNHEVYLLLSTPGGSVSSGITAYNTLKTFPVFLTIVNTGNIQSIGNVIYQSGKHRIATPSSSFMFHGIGFDLPQNTRLELKDVKERLVSLENDQNLMANILAKHTNLDLQAVNQLFLQMEFVDTDNAIKYGITDEITEVRFPKGQVPIHQIVFNKN